MGKTQTISPYRFNNPYAVVFFLPKSKRNLFWQRERNIASGNTTSGNITSGNVTSGNITSGNENFAKTTWSEMKIYLLGLLFLVALNVIVAAPSDKDKNDEDAWEWSWCRWQPVNLEKILEFTFVQKRRNLFTDQKDQWFLGREIQDGTNKSQLDMLSAQIQRLQDQVDDQHDKQQKQINELTRVNRFRRHDNDTVEHLKDTVEHLKDTVEHLKESIAGLSQCEVGSKSANPVPKSTSTFTISFGRSFMRTPTVETSLKGINWGGTYWGFDTWATSTTTTQFVLNVSNNGGVASHRGITVAWIACA